MSNFSKTKSVREKEKTKKATCLHINTMRLFDFWLVEMSSKPLLRSKVPAVFFRDEHPRFKVRTTSPRLRELTWEDGWHFRLVSCEYVNRVESARSSSFAWRLSPLLPYTAGRQRCGTLSMKWDWMIFTYCFCDIIDVSNHFITLFL